MNLYGYVNNDPVNLTDPSGLGPVEFFSCLANGGSFSGCLSDEIDRLKNGPAGDNKNGDGLGGSIFPPVDPPGGSMSPANDNSSKPIIICGDNLRGPPGPKSKGICKKTHEAISGSQKTCWYYCPQDGTRVPLTVPAQLPCFDTIGFGSGQ